MSRGKKTKRKVGRPTTKRERRIKFETDTKCAARIEEMLKGLQEFKQVGKYDHRIPGSMRFLMELSIYEFHVAYNKAPNKVKFFDELYGHYLQTKL